MADRRHRLPRRTRASETHHTPIRSAFRTSIRHGSQTGGSTNAANQEVRSALSGPRPGRLGQKASLRAETSRIGHDIPGAGSEARTAATRLVRPLRWRSDSARRAIIPDRDALDLAAPPARCAGSSQHFSDHRQQMLTMGSLARSLDDWTSKRAPASTVSPTTTCSMHYDTTGEASRPTMPTSRCSSDRPRTVSRWRSVLSTTLMASRSSTPWRLDPSSGKVGGHHDDATCTTSRRPRALGR